MNNLEVDTRQVLNLFSDLTGRQQKQAKRNALRQASRILVNETKKQLRQVIGSAINHRNRWNGRTLGSGIKNNANREGTEAKVHIMGDFRLKFFEKGTAIRRLRRNGANRGKINASYFFRTAKQNKEREIFNTLDNLLSQSIQRIANRNRR